MSSSVLRNAVFVSLAPRRIARTAGVASIAACCLAIAAPGDLDPAIGDAGRVRVGNDFSGVIWSLEALKNDAVLVAGGDFGDDYYCFYCDYYDYYAYSGFARLLANDGTFDPAFDDGPFDDTLVFDTAVQADGRVAGAGIRTLEDNDGVLIAFRLLPTGVLDPEFGDGGRVSLGSEGLDPVAGYSVVVGPGDRVVVAGVHEDRLRVFALRPDGTLDPTFGVDGVFDGPHIAASSTRIRMLLVADGYRISFDREDLPVLPIMGCEVLAITFDGRIDSAYGNDGYAGMRLPGNGPAECHALAAGDDGTLVVGGAGDGGGFAIRLLTSGQRDERFSAPDVPGALATVTAIEVADNGEVIAGGTTPGQVAGAQLLWLHADGSRNDGFGDRGVTTIDLPSTAPAKATVTQLLSLGDGSVLAGVHHGGQDAPFVVRMLGRGSANRGPGVLGIEGDPGPFEERDGRAVVSVRRTGGDAGAVSVQFATRPSSFSVRAQEGADYQPISGRLEWADGERGTKEIVVSIAPGDATVEATEWFDLALSDAQGGAGLAASAVSIGIRADPDFVGVLRILSVDREVREGVQAARVTVLLERAADAPVSATLQLVADSATAGEDFDARPIPLSWAAGVQGALTASVPILDDTRIDHGEQFIVRLVDPSPGALIDGDPEATITILDNDREPSSLGNGGGGALDFGALLALLGLGFARSRGRGTLRH